MYACLYKDGIQTIVAFILPCPWLYNEIGKNLVKKSSPVSFYSSEDVSFSVSQMIDFTEQVAKTADKTTKQKIIQAFIKRSYFELRY